MVKQKIKLFNEYTNRITDIQTLDFFINTGLTLLKQKSDNIAFEYFNKELGEETAKKQQKFNDLLLRKITSRKSQFGAESYEIDYDDRHNFTCAGENEFVLRLQRIVEITMPRLINDLNSQVIEVYSKIPNNKEVVPQFVNLMNTVLENKYYTSFIDRVINPMTHLLEKSTHKHKTKQRGLIGDISSLSGGSNVLSFGKKSKKALSTVNNEIKIVNAEIKYLSI